MSDICEFERTLKKNRNYPFPAIVIRGILW